MCELRRIEREEDLVCRAVDGVCVPLLDERRTDAVCHADGVRAAALVESVREEGIELDAEHAPFRQKCAAFRPADVERVAEPRDGGQGQLVCIAAERVREPRAVEEERNAVRAADRADDLELVHCIERPVLRRM